MYKTHVLLELVFMILRSFLQDSKNKVLNNCIIKEKKGWTYLVKHPVYHKVYLIIFKNVSYHVTFISDNHHLSYDVS